MSIDPHPPGDGPRGGPWRRRPPLGRGRTPPPRAVTGQQGESLPPSPPQKRAQRAGGTRVGQPRRPMQTLCNEHRAPACKSCKGHRGVRHCCSRHHEGHPRVLGGGQRCLPVQRGGLQQQAGVLPSRRSALVPAPATREEGEAQQGRGRRRRPMAAHGAQIRATGGPPRRAHSHRTASFRRTATYRGAGDGIGQASCRL